MSSPCLAEQALAAVLVQMLRSGALSEDDVIAAAAGLPDEAAHFLKCRIIEASAPTPAEWEAEQARSRFHSIEGGRDA